MEYQKIANLLDTTSDNVSRFATKKWIEVHDQLGGNCSVNTEIRIKTPVLRADLCDYCDAYIVVKGVVTVTNQDNAKRNKSVALKIMLHLSMLHESKISNVLLIDNAED